MIGKIGILVGILLLSFPAYVCAVNLCHPSDIVCFYGGLITLFLSFSGFCIFAFRETFRSEHKSPPHSDLDDPS